MLLAERGELVVVGDRVELVVEVGEPFRWLFGDPFLVVETEMVFALAIDDVADHDERHFRDGALAAEGGEIEIDHRADSAVALPRRQIEAATERVGEAELFEAMGTPTVPFHRGMALLVEPANAVAEVAVGRVRPSDTGRTRRNQPPAAGGLVALEVRP